MKSSSREATGPGFSPRASLIVRDALGQKKYELSGEKNLLCGRSRFVDMQVKGSGVARKHLKFFLQKGVFVVEALAKNDFDINGEKKIMASLHDGDVIRLGLCEILFYERKENEVEAGDPSFQKGDEKNGDPLVQIRLQLEENRLVVFERTKTTVEALYRSGRREILHEGYQWEIGDPQRILVNENNELVPMAAGSVRVGVRVGDLFDLMDVVIDDLPLTALEIICPEEVIYLGESVQVEALGFYRDKNGQETQRRVTHLLEWKISDDFLGGFSSEQHGFFESKGVGKVFLQAAWGELQATKEIKVEAAVLKKLKVSLPEILEAGEILTLEVQGLYSDGSCRPYREVLHWERDGEPCLQVEDRSLETLQPGRCRLKAYTSFLESDFHDIEVRVSDIQDIQLIIPDELAPRSRWRPVVRVLSKKGRSYDVACLARYQVDNPQVLHIEEKEPLLETREAGYGTLTAFYLGREIIKTLQVTEKAELKKAESLREILPYVLERELPVGLSCEVHLTGIDFQGRQAKLQPRGMILHSLTPETLRVLDGTILALKPGEGRVRVSHETLEAEINIEIVAAKLVKLLIDPPRMTCLPEEKISLRALALFSDGREFDVTSQARWDLPKGLVGDPSKEDIEALLQGEYRISCSYSTITRQMMLTCREEKKIEKEAPNQVGDIFLEKVIGVGGMGRVFLGFRQVDGKAFAVKVVRARFLKNPSVVTRFIQEARVLKEFNHENIVKVFRYGKKGSRPFLVMEYLEGRSLLEQVRHQGPLSVPQAVSVIRDVARALHVLHSHQPAIVHRDIKPGNIFLTREGQVKLMDFGITQVDETGKGNQTEMMGKVLGTAHYISPEQIRKVKEVDCRSDLYSLGATFYFLLTGESPFQGDNGMDILLKHLQEAPCPLRDKLKEIPEALESLILKMLEKKPKNRTQSAAEILLALELFSAPVNLTDCFSRNF
jgi:tRNA A-37 threonylcarbamoyl transferase component Bud32